MQFQGDLEEAGRLMRRALEIERRVLEPDHPSIGESLLGLGALYRAQGDFAAAEQSLRNALEVFASPQGPESLNSARVLGELALTLALTQRWSEAEPLYRRQLEIYEQNLEEDHFLIGETLNNLGWVMSDGLQQYPESEGMLLRAVAIFDASEPEGYWSALSRWTLANNLRDQERHTEADAYYSRALEILLELGGANRAENPDLDQLIADYALSLRAAGREAEASALESEF